VEWNQNYPINDRSNYWEHLNIKERISGLFSREKHATDVLYRV
jgi:hypothetical protein